MSQIARFVQNCLLGYGKVDTHWRHGGAMKDAGMRIRVEQDLREEFVATCQAQHLPAAQVLREFMRGYVKKNNSSAKKLKSKLPLHKNNI
jgi:hypothetical protein